MNTWQNELKNSFRSLDDIRSSYPSLKLDSLDKVSAKYPVFVPRRIMDKIHEAPNGKIAKQFLPHNDELDSGGLFDPIGDNLNSPMSRIVHRYTNRILFFPTSKCPIHCRYCFRKNEISTSNEIFSNNTKIFDYINKHQEINEIILSGGDPLILTDEVLTKYLESFSKIKHVTTIRFHTRFPTILPSRLNQDFLNTMNKFKDRFRIIFVIHVNCTEELDNEVSLALRKFSNSFRTLSQSVILKNVNDDFESLFQLCKKLLSLNIQPYYIHAPDNVLGAQHFKVKKELLKKLHLKLRSNLSGPDLPVFVFEDIQKSTKNYI